MSRFAVFSLIIISACTPMRPNVAPLADRQIVTRPNDAPIALFETNKPACAYDVIATVHVKSNTMAQTDDQLTQRLRAAARDLGGDAVVGVVSERVDERDRRNDDGTLSDDHSHQVAGTVVRFKGQDARCSTAGAE